MPINDPRVKHFINEVLRPIAESTRALGARYLAALTAWEGDVSALVPNDATVIDDGRAADGAPQITGAEVTALMAMLAALRGGGQQSLVEKFCVRALTAE